MTYTDADETRLHEIDAQLDEFHEQHRTPLTGSCWCCCIVECDPTESDNVPEEIGALQQEYWRLAIRRQEAGRTM